MTIDLRLGDCLEIMRAMPDASVDAVITDPPYFGREDLFATDELREQITYILNRWNALIFYPPSKNFIREPDAEHIWHKSIPIHPNSKIGNAAGHHYEKILSYGLGRKSEVFRFAAIMPNFAACSDELVKHPTQKPIALMVRLIEKYTREGDTILDPFMGSGTTGVACARLNRNFIGIEINPTYFEIAQRRIAEAQAQLTLNFAEATA